MFVIKRVASDRFQSATALTVPEYALAINFLYILRVVILASSLVSLDKINLDIAIIMSVG